MTNKTAAALRRWPYVLISEATGQPISCHRKPRAALAARDRQNAGAKRQGGYRALVKLLVADDWARRRLDDAYEEAALRGRA